MVDFNRKLQELKAKAEGRELAPPGALSQEQAELAAEADAVGFGVLPPPAEAEKLAAARQQEAEELFDARPLTPQEEDEEEQAELRELVPRYPRFEFITGSAGTGKTFLMKERAAADSAVTLCATTGIASVNLGEGTTINALLKFFDTASLRDSWTEGWLGMILAKEVRAGLRQIVLDEVSMLDGEQLTILCLAIDDVNERQEAAGQAGLGLTLTGDFCQLPPVKAKFAFEMEVWGERFEKNTTRLTKIWRQEDQDFVSALQQVRRGERSAVEFFARYLQEQTDHEYDGATIVARNELVDNFNRLRMSKLQGKWIGWTSARWGSQRGDWKNIPEKLDLKVGAYVMVLANRRKLDPYTGMPTLEFEYVNGDTGELVDALGTVAQVKLKRTGQVVGVETATRQWLKPFEVGRRKELKAEFGDKWGEHVSKDGKKEVVGAISYMPLRVAYATTVHKSQGLSLDSVQINLRDHFFKQPGMLYVALSRCRTADGLRLVGNSKSFAERCVIDARVRPWL